MKKSILTVFAIAITVVMAWACSQGKAAQEKKAAREQKAAQEAAINNIMSRKSVRSFTDQKLTGEQIETLLKAAMAAPSAINIQPWSFVVIDDDALKQELWGGARRSEMFTGAPVVVVVCGEYKTMRKPFGQPDAEPEEWENIFWSQDCSAATENLLLAAEAMGLGAVWTALYPTERMEPVIAKLGLPDNVKPLCAVPIGYPAGDDQPKDKWKPKKIHYNRW